MDSNVICGKPNTEKPQSENKNFKTHHFATTQSDDLRVATKLPGLWSLSLSYCRNLTAYALGSLSNFACFGFVDFSYASIDFVAIQYTIREVQIMRMNSIGSTLHIGDSEEWRGFAAFCLPNVWSLDGLFVTWDERRKWDEYFISGKGKYSHFMRKLYLPPNPVFVPRKECHPSKAKAKDDKSGLIVTPRAQQVLVHFPREFQMGVEQDLWRLKYLAKDLEQAVKEYNNISLKDHAIIEGSIQCMIAGSSRSDNTNTMASRVILFLLIFASFLPLFSPGRLQELLEMTFIVHRDGTAQKEGRLYNWAQNPISPLKWRVQEKMTYLSLLLGRLKLDALSETSVQDEPPLASPQLLKTWGHLLVSMLHACYESMRSTDSFDLETATINNDDISHRAFGDLPKDVPAMGTVELEVIQLFCLLPGSKEFLDEFPSLYKAYERAVLRLVPGAVAVFEGVFWEEDAFHFHTSADGEEEVNGMPVEAKATEIKYKLCVGVEKILRNFCTE
ncbi:hypothetical protein HK104_001004 [Borealophlyctis nickersoniae]|nr:hypothetical protein HK104_001004 [Borealophlyctis nickersoniae]